MAIESQGFGSDYVDFSVVLLFISSVTLGKLFDLSEPQSSHEKL